MVDDAKVAKPGLDEESKPKPSRTRSPNYPACDLKTAVELAGRIYQSYKTNLVPINLVHRLWEYAEHGSAGNQVVAAVKAYGLIEVEGTGQKRQVKLSDCGLRIVRDAPDRPTRIQNAAITPAIFNELWEKYKEDGIPPDDLIHSYLEWDRPDGKFNPEVIGDVISRFRSTIEFAGLLSSGKIVDEVDEESEDTPAEINSPKGSEAMVAANLKPPQNKPKTEQNSGYKDCPMHLPNGRFANLSIPVELTEKDMELLKKQIDHWITVVEATSIVAVSPSSEG